MGRILRTNIFTGEREWADFEGGTTKYGEAREEQKTVSAWNKPHRSIAAACHSSQVAEMNEFIKGAGIVGARHEADGTLVSDSEAAFNRVLKLKGLVNRS